MAEANTEKAAEKTQKDSSLNTVQVAFRLGWTVSEFMGRARQADRLYREKDQWTAPRDLRGFLSREAPRLSYSDGISSQESAWWQAALRLVALADALDLPKDLLPQTEVIRTWPDSIYRLTYRLPPEDGKQQVEKPSEAEWRSPRDYFEVLEPWCRQVELMLNARDEMAALAFSTGGEIADTFWFMRRDRWGERRDGRDDSWHKLIHHQRLNVIIDQLKTFEDRLPPLVGPALRFSLFRWGIARDLGYRGERLVVEGEWLWHRFHWWPWMIDRRKALLERRRKRENRPRERKGQGVLESLDKKDEELLYNRLFEQSRRWQELILGERLPLNYLDFRARLTLFWQSWLSYLVLLLLIAAVAAGIGYLLFFVLGSGLVWIGDWIVAFLTPEKAQPGTLKDSFEIAKIVIPVLTGLVAFVGGVLRTLWQEAVGLYPRVREWLTRRKVERATWVSWRAKKSQQ